MDSLLELFSRPDTYISLLTLTLMEIVLGIDNIIFISIVASRLPQEQQAKARFVGLSLALVFRIILLMCIGWIVRLTNPLITLLGHDISGRDLILIAGGIFLLIKSTKEIHHKIEQANEEADGSKVSTFMGVVSQIIMLDIVFSFDSVITAVGLVQEVPLMVVAVVVSLIVMLIFAPTISDFINKHPTLKMLALSFLLMIGTLLVAEGFHVHVPKGYVYFAMAFSVFVEFLNLKLRKPVAT